MCGRGGGRFRNNYIRSRECGGGRSRSCGAIKDCGRIQGCIRISDLRRYCANCGRFRDSISDLRRYRANRGRFQSFIKKFNNIENFSEARELKEFETSIVNSGYKVYKNRKKKDKYNF